jgi:hypothetical protein
MDWMCYRIIDDSIFHYPGIRIPVRLLTNMKEIEFIAEKFYVPNPPDEYLHLKYGEEWMIPKKTGFEKDVLDLIPEAPLSLLAMSAMEEVLPNVILLCTWII